MSRGEIFFAVALGLFVNELGDWCPWLARRLVGWSARRRYGELSERAIIRTEELTAVIDDRPGKLFKVVTACGFAVAAVVAGIRNPGLGVLHHLLPAERVTVLVRRHWAAMGPDALLSFVVVGAGGFGVYAFQGEWMLVLPVVLFVLSLVVRFVWVVATWWTERFIVTDRRVLLTTGVLRRRVAMIPLGAISEFACRRSATGRALGYGKIIIETTGRPAALSCLNYAPRPSRLYLRISELLVSADEGGSLS